MRRRSACAERCRKGSRKRASHGVSLDEGRYEFAREAKLVRGRGIGGGAPCPKGVGGHASATPQMTRLRKLESFRLIPKLAYGPTYPPPHPQGG